MKKVYQSTAEEILSMQNTCKTGLSAQEASRRLDQYGFNRLSEGRKRNILQLFFDQFRDLLVVILLVAAGISFFSGSQQSTVVIFAVILINSILGTVQARKTEKSLESLKQMSAPMAKVLRDGVPVEIPASGVVPGDVLILETGDRIVADGILLENFSLRVNESALTGESEAVEKYANIELRDDTALGDRCNMVFSGCLVTYGRAYVIVTATGMDTEIGKIAHLMCMTEQRKTPLQVSLDQFSRNLACVILGICIVVLSLSIFRSHMGVLDAIMFAVALAVAAIPEALSSVVTIILAIGTQKMARQHAVMKDLKAVESLGCVSIICSDKTGTLTQNRMMVQKIFADNSLFAPEALDLQNPVHSRLLQIGLLACDATTDERTGQQIGDPTEVALVQMGDARGIDELTYRARYPRLSELAFDSNRKRMSTLHELDGTHMMLTKGALDVLLERSSFLLSKDGIVTLSDAERREILQRNAELSAQGLRVLAFAQRDLNDTTTLTYEDEEKFIFVGMFAMMDPARPEAIDAITSAKQGGVRTIMITGDHPVTATAIAKQIGIWKDGDQTLTGAQLDAMCEQELVQQLDHISVYARVSPEHKIRIVSAWQRCGEIVAMTGDGVNDAPALKKADIGIAMGITGTAVSKDAADIILTDDNFATIVRAIESGRSVYSNIKNTIHFLLSGNMAGILCVLFASLLGIPAPFAPVHLLFINLLTDSLPAIAIGMEPAQHELLCHCPRDPNAPIVDRKLGLQILMQGLLLAIPTMLLFWVGYQDKDISRAMTLAFATLTLARLFHGFNCRGKQSIFMLGFRSNHFLLFALALGILLLAAVLCVPSLQILFAVTPLVTQELFVVVGMALLPTACIQFARIIRMCARK